MRSLPQPTPPAPLGRIPVVDPQVTAENGRWPTKAVVGEAVPLRATIFREGHDRVGATAVLIDPRGRETTTAMRLEEPGVDLWAARVVPTSEGHWSWRVEGWADPLRTWQHAATVKVDAGVDVDLVLAEGVELFSRWAGAAQLTPWERTVLTQASATLADETLTPIARLSAGTSPDVDRVYSASPLREAVCPSAIYPLRVHRPRALFSSWYEFFPRSEGALRRPDGTWQSGTLATAAERLEAIAELGFDVVYLTPVHPIGATNRKGPNNTLTAREGDPGSPYGIGSAEGGHDAIHPELGTVADFERFTSTAHRLGLEVALDIALQASPDHPWVKEHPQWFTTRLDGTIAYAENPPKKYQDIYPLNFDNDPEGIYVAVRDMLLTWVQRGVTLFRVDNPHTKPLQFWERLLAEFDERHPEVIFLAEAFTRPPMMRALAEIGFHQSYCYFTWRNTKEEVSTYLAEVSGDLGAVMRPAFWPTTHDILTPYLQTGGIGAFAIRAIIAATGSPTWGIYSGYELAENVARPGVEEQLDNEKYEFKPRDWEGAAAANGLTDLLRRLNEIRRAHPCLQQLRNLTIHPTTDSAIVAFSKHLDADHSPTGKADTVLVVVTTDPHSTRAGHLELDLEALGVPLGSTFTAHDTLTGETYQWDARPYVRLDPRGRCAHIIEVS